MIDEGDIVAVFHSIHRVMKAEKILKGKKFAVKVIPMPRQLSSDCGMAIKFPRELLPAIETALAEEDLTISETWLKRDDELQRLS